MCIRDSDYPGVCQYTGASSIPKFQTSTFNQESLFDTDQEFTYTRFDNPTVHALDEGFKSFYGAEYGLSFASGMAAISTALLLFEAGDHLIFPIEVYGGAYQFSSSILPKYGMEVSYVDMSDICLLYTSDAADDLLTV